MSRTKLRNQFLKKKTLEAKTKYNKQGLVFFQYLPISILSNFLKICERCLSQLYNYFGKSFFFQNTNAAFVKALVLSIPF